MTADLWAMVRVITDPTAPMPKRSTFIPADGINRLLPADLLPFGWVAVQELNVLWNPVYECSGPVVSENARWIYVSVSGKTLGIVKRWATITRSLKLSGDVA